MILLSYCTTCYKRLHQLDAIYLHNVNTQRNLPVEFVLLDYGRDPALLTWFYANRRHLRSVRLVRLTAPPTYFQHALAKNMAHKYATGDIVCNLDADSILIAGFTELTLTEVADRQRAVVLAPPDYRFYGRIAMRRRHFDTLGGYDERFQYGACWEDTDLIQRAVESGMVRRDIPPAYYVSMTHSQAARHQYTADPSGQLAQQIHGELMRKRVSGVANPLGWGRWPADVIEPLPPFDDSVTLSCA